jgi:hypothetical protein
MGQNCLFRGRADTLLAASNGKVKAPAKERQFD